MKYQKIPRSRIATFDVFSRGLQKHHVHALLEIDVTESRKKLKSLRKEGHKISFNAWLIKVISKVLEKHPEAAGYMHRKRKLVMFHDINISFLIEKEIHGKKVPIPLVLKKTNEKSTQEITREIENAKNQALGVDDVVLGQRSRAYERIYFRLPGFVRSGFWKFLLNHPKLTYRKMGNVAITSLGMIGRINGWFIHRSVHPLSFGVGSVIRKPIVIHDEIRIREILNMTILLDHDVIDGAPMVRFVNDLTDFIESGSEI